MLRDQVEANPNNDTQSIAERLQRWWTPDREPDLKFDTVRIQERDNPPTVLDTFFNVTVQPPCFMNDGFRYRSTHPTKNQ